MFQLKVVGLAEATNLIAEEWPTRIVSLLNEDLYIIGDHHLHVRVSDVVLATGEKSIQPTLDHLLEVLAFTLPLTDDDRLLVHCYAGISRSTALAIAICIQHGLPYHAAFEYVSSIRNILLPNQLFIAYIDEHFNLDGKLIELVNARRKQALTNALILPSSDGWTLSS